MTKRFERKRASECTQSVCITLAHCKRSVSNGSRLPSRDESIPCCPSTRMPVRIGVVVRSSIPGTCDDVIDGRSDVIAPQTSI